MSPPTDAKTDIAEPTLIADGAPGVDIMIIDSHFRPVARGVTKLETRLPEGVYTVRFSAAGRAEDKPVRLLPIARPLVVEGGRFAIGSAPPSASSDAAELEHIQASAVSTLTQNAPQRGYDELVVFVRAPGATRADASRSIRLFDAKDVAVRSKDDDEVEAEQILSENEHGWAARQYSVRAGVYRLHYETNTRKLVEQTVYVFPRRRTFAFLKYGHAVEFAREDNGYKQVRRRGIDPAQTTLVSAGTSNSKPDADDLRLADILLHALGSSSVGLDQKLIAKLAEPGTCPYLKLYASAVLIRRLESATCAHDADNEPSVVEEISPEIPQAWLERTSIRLLQSMPQPRTWPDVQCCGWRLASLTENRFSLDLSDTLSAPPMLDCSWQWAVAHSFDRPGTLPNAGVFRSASEARLRAAPWLVWRSASTSSSSQKPSASAEESTTSLENLLTELDRSAPQSPTRFAPSEAEYAGKRVQRLFDSLTPPARQMVSTLLHLERNAVQEPTIDLKIVGSSLGAPLESLQEWVEDTLRQVARPRPRLGVLEIQPSISSKSAEHSLAHGFRLSANESPLGPSAMAIKAYHDVADHLNEYPDGAATALREAIGRSHGLNPDHIVCGAGSDELLNLLARAYLAEGDEAIHTTHGFLVYPIATRSTGAVPVVATETNLTANVDAILAIVTKHTRILFLANPNNPTGTYLPLDEIKRLHRELPPQVLFVIDAAYAEYVRRTDYESGIELAASSQNVVMCRTFSKIYGLAGLRLGWLFGPSHVVGTINRIRGPFNVNGPAAAAGVAAIEDTQHVELARAHNARWLPWLTNKILKLGLDVTPSVANFILIHFPTEPKRTAADAHEFLTRRGLILRRTTAYRLPNALRMTIGSEEANRLVVAALAEFMGRT